MVDEDRLYGCDKQEKRESGACGQKSQKIIWGKAGWGS